MLPLAISLSYSQTTYYVSSSEGNDSNDGTSADTPWKTPNKVTGHGPFQPGDFILFKRGDIFQGEITQQYLEGKVNQRIVFGAYGTGAKPIIYGDMTGATWTKTTGRKGVWQAFSGYFYSSFAYEYYSADWHLLKDANNGDLHFSLSNTDSLTKFKWLDCIKLWIRQ